MSSDRTCPGCGSDVDAAAPAELAREVAAVEEAAGRLAALASLLADPPSSLSLYPSPN